VDRYRTLLVFWNPATLFRSRSLDFVPKLIPKV
jgi:hypothetical protein